MKVSRHNTKYQYSVSFLDNLVSISVFACFISKIGWIFMLHKLAFAFIDY